MTNPQDQGELIELQSEDGYPSGFTMVDNWTGQSSVDTQLPLCA